MNGFWTLGPRLWMLMRRRPGTIVAIVLAGAAVAWGVWSCQTPARHAEPAALAIPTAEPEVRIRIRSAVQNLVLEGPKRFTVKQSKGADQQVDGPLILAVTPEGVRVGDDQGRALMTLGWGVTELSAIGDPQAVSSRIRIDSSVYPGRIRIHAKPAVSMADGGSGAGARMDVVEVVGIEDYLVGVVAAELYPDWKNPRIFEVQAVCARTYALHERQRSIDLGQEWDLESTEEDQAYKGTFKAEAYKAVRDTRGIVLTWEGKLLRAYYSSTCGGRTAAAADTWPTGPGYEYNLAAPIQSHHRESMCGISPRYRWEVTRDRALLSAQWREWGKARSHAISGLGQIKSVAVEKANTDGRPARYTVTDSANKTFSISAEQLRLASNFKALGVPPVTKDTLVRSGDFELEIRASNAVIRGRGFGHGVGMCQFCAKAMADRGDSWQVQVARFYPGAKIERAY